jgi:chromatin structure-remodeling complex subunit RSC1/2
VTRAAPGHFADHPVEDIVEKIACQFTARHIRGRPRPPSWYLGWPLYVCDSRYNDRERIFVKIKNWNSCVPEEVRKSADFMPIYPFERMVFPRRFGSPFLKGARVRGPGGIGESVDRAEGERIEGGGTGRKRTRKAGAPTDISGPSKGLYVGVGPANVAGVATPQPVVYAAQPAGSQSRTEDRSIVTAAGGATVLGANANMEKLLAETGAYRVYRQFFLGSELISGYQRGILTGTRKRTRFCGSRRHLSALHGHQHLGIVCNICTGSRRSARG